LSAAIGAVICLVGAYTVAVAQASVRTPGNPVWLSIWPLPGLALLEWSVLGMVALVGVVWGRPGTLTLAWVACGALAALVILGAASIGLTVLLALVFLTVAALLASMRRERNLFRDAGSFLLGTLVNFALFALLILLEYLY
jgi:hypothetical protein